MASIGLELEPVSRPYTSGSSGPQVPPTRVRAFFAASSPRNAPSSAFARCACGRHPGRAAGGREMHVRAPMPENMINGSVVREQSQPSDALVASSQLHKQLLAQEVVKLRREVATLRAATSFPTVEDDEEIRSRGGRRARARLPGRGACRWR